MIQKLKNIPLCKMLILSVSVTSMFTVYPAETTDVSSFDGELYSSSHQNLTPWQKIKSFITQHPAATAAIGGAIVFTIGGGIFVVASRDKAKNPSLRGSTQAPVVISQEERQKIVDQLANLDKDFVAFKDWDGDHIVLLKGSLEEVQNELKAEHIDLKNAGYLEKIITSKIKPAIQKLQKRKERLDALEKQRAALAEKVKVGDVKEVSQGRDALYQEVVQQLLQLSATQGMKEKEFNDLCDQAEQKAKQCFETFNRYDITRDSNNILRDEYKKLDEELTTLKNKSGQLELGSFLVAFHALFDRFTQQLKNVNASLSALTEKSSTQECETVKTELTVLEKVLFELECFITHLEKLSVFKDLDKECHVSKVINGVLAELAQWSTLQQLAKLQYRSQQTKMDELKNNVNKLLGRNEKIKEFAQYLENLNNNESNGGIDDATVYEDELKSLRESVAQLSSKLGCSDKDFADALSVVTTSKVGYENRRKEHNDIQQQCVSLRTGIEALVRESDEAMRHANARGVSGSVDSSGLETTKKEAVESLMAVETSLTSEDFDAAKEKKEALVARIEECRAASKAKEEELLAGLEAKKERMLKELTELTECYKDFWGEDDRDEELCGAMLELQRNIAGFAFKNDDAVINLQEVGKSVSGAGKVGNGLILEVYKRLGAIAQESCQGLEEVFGDRLNQDAFAAVKDVLDRVKETSQIASSNYTVENVKAFKDALKALFMQDKKDIVDELTRIVIGMISEFERTGKFNDMSDGNKKVALSAMEEFAVVLIDRNKSLGFLVRAWKKFKQVVLKFSQDDTKHSVLNNLLDTAAHLISPKKQASTALKEPASSTQRFANQQVSSESFVTAFNASPLLKQAVMRSARKKKIIISSAGDGSASQAKYPGATPQRLDFGEASSASDSAMQTQNPEVDENEQVEETQFRSLTKTEVFALILNTAPLDDE